MIDIDEIMKRAQAASDRASQQLNENIEKGQKIAEQMKADVEKAKAERAARQQEAEAQAAEQMAANQQRQVEILGQMFSPETMAQMADTEALIQKMVDEKVSETAVLGVEGMMDQLFGEDMGVIAAALETLTMEEGEDDDEDDRDLDLALEEELEGFQDEKLAQLETLPEPEPSLYSKDDTRWARFKHPALRHHLQSQRPPTGPHGRGGACTGDGTADRLAGASLLGHQRERRTSGHHPLSYPGGLHPALPDVLRGCLPGGARGRDG